MLMMVHAQRDVRRPFSCGRRRLRQRGTRTRLCNERQCHCRCAETSLHAPDYEIRRRRAESMIIVFGMVTKRAAKRGQPAKRTSGRYWSKRVMDTSDALDLQKGVFKLPPKKMARSLKRSAERSGRRKSAPLRSAMSMLSFYENRAGRKLPASRKRQIAQAKQELRRLFGKER